ncbi:hypothetical protein AXG93_138s1100 [Marchantia polymorpha subsp. ruderalis]|uniref:Uncharacterized protein n=1 Tax=Marchantia polymorpha subsp. ruderalis TaxID=1480154 RepID=A0A176VLK2_MARPO|nr:hypothetical protein AXG93_138s1100 [Marchantia polymorpha subsp. ruderalis]
MENVKELYDIEHSAPDDYKGPTKYETEFIIGPVANAGLSKMHAAMHTALHHHMGRGHKDRHCCSPNFDPGIRLRSRSLRNSLVYGTRKVRTKGLKVDESIRMMQVKFRSRSIRDSLVYGTRTKRCRHKQCTAWDHQHEWNEVLEKWDVPMSMLHNEKKRSVWFEARQSVLDQEMIRRKSIPRNRYGELETDGGLYCGYYLPEVILRPWHQGGHTHDFYRYTRDIRPDDWMWEPQWYDPEPEKIEYHIRKIKELWNWHRRRNLIGDMRYMFARIAEARRQRRHFQRLKLRLKKKVLLWTELNRNSLWFNPWPEGDQQPELVRRSLMMISKRLSTCAPMWNEYFADLPTCEFFLNHLDELAPEVWERFHFNCKLHKHLDQHERRATLQALIAAANAEPVEEEEKIVLPPLCAPVLALEEFRRQWADLRAEWAAIMAARAPPPAEIPPTIDEIKDGKKGSKQQQQKALPAAAIAESQPPKARASAAAAADSKDKKDVRASKDEKDVRASKDEKDVRASKAPQGSSSTKPGIEAPEKKGVGPAVQPAAGAPAAKRKKSVKLDPPPLPAQVVFLKKGEGRQSMSKPPPTAAELKLLLLDRPLPPEEDLPAPEPVEEYVPFKFPLRKRRVRWSIIGGKVPILPPPGSRPPLSPESAKAALDLLDLDAFEAKLEAAKPKVAEKKGKGKGKDAVAGKDKKKAQPKKKVGSPKLKLLLQNYREPLASSALPEFMAIQINYNQLER